MFIFRYGIEILSHTSTKSFRNDLVDVCEENIKMYLFADDAKMYCHVKNVADKDKLQIGIENFVDWTSKYSNIWEWH